MAGLVQRLYDAGGETAEKSRLAAEAFRAVLDDLEPVRGLHVFLHRPIPPRSEKLAPGQRRTTPLQMPGTGQKRPRVSPRAIVRAFCGRNQFPGRTRVRSSLPLRVTGKQVKRIDLLRMGLAPHLRPNQRRNVILGGSWRQGVIPESYVPRRRRDRPFSNDWQQRCGCALWNLDRNARLDGWKTDGL